jgi:tetratricopeptide (TPR) repeat protein
MKYYDLILNIDSKNIKALNNKGFIHQNLGNFKEALELYYKALEVDPSYPLTLLNIGIINLTKRKFGEGWKNYSFRIKNSENGIYFPSSKPELLDFNISNKTIFIWPEQGVGDQIIYSSLLPDAFKTKNNFYVSLEPRLLPLFRRSFSSVNNVTFISGVENPLDLKFDYQLPIGSLGKFFRNSIQDFSSQPTAYLKADKIKTNQLKQKINKNKKNICGISWMSKNKEFGEEKSLSLIQLLPILSIPNTIFVNLQYGDTSKEIKNISDQYGIEIMSMNEIDNFNDLDGLASLIEACDYIVTSSNVTAHIAGALYKKTYLLLPYAYGKIWYWGENDTHSLWYPSVDIYRNTNSNSWEKPIADLSEKLRASYE